LDRKVDTIAGAMAAVAQSQNDLIAKLGELDQHRGHDTVDLAHRLDSLERLVLELTKGIEGKDARTDDRLAAIRDAASVPVNDLKDLLLARTERTEKRLDELIGQLERTSAALAESTGPAPSAAASPELAAVADHLDVLADRVDALGAKVDGLDISGPLTSTTEELRADLEEHTDAALAGLLRLVDERVTALRSAIDDASAAAAAGGGGSGGSAGFEAGAVMGAAQAAWNRLEQRLDNEFDDLGRQMQALGTLIEQALAAAEAAANRPVVSGESIRKTATSVREALANANRSRRERRGGPRSLGPGSDS